MIICERCEGIEHLSCRGCLYAREGDHLCLHCRDGPATTTQQVCILYLCTRFLALFHVHVSVAILSGTKIVRSS